MPFNKRNPLSQPLSLNLSLKQKPLHTAQPGQSSLSAAQPRLAWSLLMRLPLGLSRSGGRNHSQVLIINNPHTHPGTKSNRERLAKMPQGFPIDRADLFVINRPHAGATAGKWCWYWLLRTAQLHLCAPASTAGKFVHSPFCTAGTGRPWMVPLQMPTVPPERKSTQRHQCHGSLR